MSSKKPRTDTKLVFFGTGPTSLEALEGLVEEFEVELVVTKPPASNSAGKSFLNPVHKYAIQKNLKVITPSTKSELEAEFATKKLKSVLGAVLDYGMIIPKVVIDKFPKGILNSHFSLLPKYRGANPIRAAILAGDKTTGITIIKITPGLDDGPILTWALVDTKHMDAIELRTKLSEINSPLLCETIRLYVQGELDMVEQDEAEATITTKTVKDDGLISPSKSAVQLERQVRAYAGWPKSTLELDGKSYIVHKVKPTEFEANKGSLEANGGKLYYGCKHGSIEILRIQPQGKAAMDGRSFINGYLK